MAGTVLGGLWHCATFSNVPGSLLVAGELGESQELDVARSRCIHGRWYGGRLLLPEESLGRRVAAVLVAYITVFVRRITRSE